MLQAVNNRVERAMQERISRNIQSSIFEQIRRLGFAYFDQHPVGESVSLMQSELDNLDIPIGQTIAFVGESGCGKSTVVSLLARFYDPTEGRILVNGVRLNQLHLFQWKERISIVMQEPYCRDGLS